MAWISLRNAALCIIVTLVVSSFLVIIIFKKMISLHFVRFSKIAVLPYTQENVVVFCSHHSNFIYFYFFVYSCLFLILFPNIYDYFKNILVDD